MNYVGIDIHKCYSVFAAQDDLRLHYAPPAG